MAKKDKKVAHKQYILRKRNGTYEYVVVPETESLPTNRKKFNHCGNCGSPHFVEKLGGWACKKCRLFFRNREWEYVR